MNLIEQIEKLLVNDYGRVYELRKDLRAIIEQHKSEAVEPVAVPEGYKLVPIEPTDDMKRAYTDKYGFPSYGAGHEYRFMVKEAPEAPQPDHTKLIGEMVEALDAFVLYDDTVGYGSYILNQDIDIDALLTKAREAIK